MKEEIEASINRKTYICRNCSDVNCIFSMKGEEGIGLSMDFDITCPVGHIVTWQAYHDQDLSKKDQRIAELEEENKRLMNSVFSSREMQKLYYEGCGKGITTKEIFDEIFKSQHEKLIATNKAIKEKSENNNG